VRPEGNARDKQRTLSPEETERSGVRTQRRSPKAAQCRLK